MAGSQTAWLVLAAVGPTPFWYATRGSGYAALLLLRAVVVLGLLMSARWRSDGRPSELDAKNIEH